MNELDLSLGRIVQMAKFLPAVAFLKSLLAPPSGQSRKLPTFADGELIFTWYSLF